ncbi:hypothetical protein C8R47DRAFT_1151326 [Mycena vitilis]|nr:hypothetical protein C8R47DRAFT_1151326 [Mycena vitilis]
MLAELEADRLRVAELQTRILSLERRVSELRLEQLKVQERLDSYKYPVWTVPPEIISEIFMRTLPPYPRAPPLIGPSSPTTLTQICRQWRELALDLSPLWSVVHLGDSASGLGWAKHMVRLWLERSRCCPLDIRLGPNTNRVDDALVLSHRARWECLELHRKELDPDIFAGPMPLLRRVKIQFDERPRESFSLHDVPLLRSAVLDYMAASQVVLPWTQLTSLTLLEIYPDECVPILLKTPNLVHCELRLLFDGPQDLDGRDIPLPYLESLVFIDRGQYPATDFLSTFIVPALRALTIPEAFLKPNPIGMLSAFISRSACRLQELNLRTGRAASVSANSYREAFPSLWQLSLDGLSLPLARSVCA